MGGSSRWVAVVGGGSTEVVGRTKLSLMLQNRIQCSQTKSEEFKS